MKHLVGWGSMRWDQSFSAHGCTGQTSKKASLRGEELPFSYAAGANFRGSDMRGCSLYRAEVGLLRSRHVSANFTDALVDEASDIPELKVFGERRL